MQNSIKLRLCCRLSQLIKTIIFSILFIICINCINNTLYSQSYYNVEVKLDSSINADKERIYISIDNGRFVVVPETDSLNNRKNKINISGIYFTKYAEISILLYKIKNGAFEGLFATNHFIDKESSSIDISRTTDSTFIARSTNTLDITNIPEHISKQKNLKEFSNKKAFILSQFRSDKRKNDSLRNEYKKLLFEFHKELFPYLKSNNSSYYCFWYFRNELFGDYRMYLKEDSAYLSYLRRNYIDIFKDTYLQTKEGQYLLKEIDNNKDLYTIKLDRLQLKSEGGELIDFSKIDSEFIMFDFWATWCPPCMRDIPILKEIKNKTDVKQLTIIGINWDSDRKKYLKAVESMNIDWLQIPDPERKIEDFGILNFIPVKIITDRNGNILYDNRKDGDEDIASVINKLLKN